MILVIVKPYIKQFEEQGFGMFVHFGAYSVLAKGEWAKCQYNIPYREYDNYVKSFCPKPDWAKELVEAAKEAGCRYITLTTRHHDGFSLFDTCGLNDYDTVHTCGRDLVREFTDACHAAGITPSFYHTLLDWHEPTYKTDFPAYLGYLRKSVEILCKNYGKIGGLWFDGWWDKKDADWEEDALYATIRAYQPEAIIINNTGLCTRGMIRHPELDSVTFERGKPFPINTEDAPKYLASEMCETLNDHWGYAKNDLHFKSSAEIIETLCDCRRCGSNLLLNIGPDGNGNLRLMDKAILNAVGQWVNLFDEAIRAPKPYAAQVEGREKDFVLKNGKNYYLFCFSLPVFANENVALNEAKSDKYTDRFTLAGETVKRVYWMETGTDAVYKQDGNTLFVQAEPFTYGNNTVVRVAKIECE